MLILLFVFEPTLVYPGKNFDSGNWNPTHFSYREVEFDSADGTKIVGWYLSKRGSTRTVLVHHGNGENVAQAAAYVGNEIRQLLNANVLVFDYRGYGKSEGSPYEQGVLEDAEAALNWLNHETGTTPKDTIILGHSLGGGPACYLAGKFGAKALILQRTFSSLVNVAQNRYPWVPVSLLMRNRYPSEKRICNYEGPLFQSHGTADTLIPIEIGRKLFDCCPSQQKVFCELDGLGHLDPYPNEYWGTLREFIESIDRLNP